MEEELKENESPVVVIAHLITYFTYLITYLPYLTYSVEHWRSYRLSASQEIPHILWN